MTALLFLFHMKGTPAPGLLTAGLISTIDQTYRAKTSPLRKGIQESAETSLIQFGSRDARL